MNATVTLVPVTIPAEDVTVGQRIRPNSQGEGSTVVRITDRPDGARIIDLASVRLLQEGASAYEATAMVVEFPGGHGNLTTYLPEGTSWEGDTFHVRNAQADAWYLLTGGTERRTQRG